MKLQLTSLDVAWFTDQTRSVNQATLDAEILSLQRIQSLLESAKTTKFSSAASILFCHTK